MKLAKLARVFPLAVALTAALSVRGLSEEPKPRPAAAQRASLPSRASRDDINRWITELGHDAYTVRQAAAAQLLSAGVAARGPLVAIIDGPDPEIRAAARRLIAQIDKSEFHRRLEAFAADTEGKRGLSLPGWEEFQKLVGSDPAARALFVDMQRQEGGLITTILNGSARSSSDLMEARIMQLFQMPSPAFDRGAALPLPSCATMLFLGSVDEADVNDKVAHGIESLLQRSPILETLRSDNHQDAGRRVAIAWLLHCPAKGEDILQHRLGLIGSLGIEEALPLALAVVSGDPQYKRAQPASRALASLIVGQFGRAEHIEKLESLLEDTAVAWQVQMQQPTTVQVRDTALVALLQLTDQQPSDYGYTNARPQSPKTYQPPTLFRENDAQRAEAIAKWRTWRAAHKDLPAKPKSP